MKNIIVMTTTNHRIEKIEKMLYSICEQTYKPDIIKLYFSEKPFFNLDNGIKEEYIRQYLNKLDLADKISLHNVENIGSYKKFFFELLDKEEKIITTVDDDVIYPKNWYEQIMSSWEISPDTVKCFNSSKIIKNKNNLEEYNLWPDQGPGIHHDSFFKGNYSVSYKRSYFNGYENKINLMIENARLQDDIVLNYIIKLKNIKIYTLDKNKLLNDFIDIQMPKNTTLWEINKFNQNDKILNNINFLECLINV